MDLLNLNINVILKHILNVETRPLLIEIDDGPVGASSNQQQQQQHVDGQSEQVQTLDPNQQNVSSKGILRKLGCSRAGKLVWIGKNQVGESQVKRKTPSDPIKGRDSRLDLSGPPLMEGFQTKLWFYRLIGTLNFSQLPLIVSLLIKTVILSISFYKLYDPFILAAADLNIIDKDFRNPIFLFIGFLSLVCTIMQIIVNIYVTTFKFGPIQAILESKQLCFIRPDVLRVVGSGALPPVLTFILYQNTLFQMLCKKDFNQFIETFNLLEFIIYTYIFTVVNFSLIGLGFIDFYVRTAFGHWLLAIKDHLEKQFVYLRRNKYKSTACMGSVNFIGGQVTSQGGSLSNNGPATIQNNNWQRTNSNTANDAVSEQGPNQTIKLITLDEVQRSLNAMDDHLEVMRSTHSFNLVVLSLNAFLGNGLLILITYHLLSDQNNYYHGLIMLMITVNGLIIVFCNYFGDLWVFYGLQSLVQCIEDEYFLQRDIEEPSVSKQNATGSSAKSIEWHDSEEDLASLKSESGVQLAESLGAATIRGPNYKKGIRLMNDLSLLKKKHVLFFREFLHQFENHLGTPWSNLTFESHLHIIRAFITLIAAQIIFDHH